MKGVYAPDNSVAPGPGEALAEEGQRMIDTSRLEGTGFPRRKLEGLRVGVIGLGAVGNEVVKTLGLLGPASVLCADPDVVEASNLTRSVFYDVISVGQPKAVALVRAARTRFLGTRWEEFAGEVADLGWGRLADLDLMFGCVDRDSARLEMARIGTRLGLPVCDGGLGVSRGRVSYFPGRVAACFGCRLSAPRRRELLREWRSDAYPCGTAMPEGGRPSTPTMAAITGALAVELGLRALWDGCSESFTTEIELSAPPRCETIRINVSEGCPFHEERNGPPAPLTGCFAEHLAPGGVIGWEWPICTRARCRACGEQWEPMMRKARVRRCPRCGSSDILLVECLNRIRHGSPWADKSPEEIGLPSRHLYTVWGEV
jgi:adenylyltransferase/sulfurtransferase